MQGRLWRFDPGANDLTVITAQLSPSMDGLAFDLNTGLFYGISQTTLDLYSVDPATGTTTLVMHTGIGLPSGLAGLAFAPGTT